MAKAKSVFVCAECGATALKWMGLCPSCGEAGTLSEQAAERGSKSSDIRQKVEGWRDRAMKSASLHDSPTTRKLFAEHLGALWDRSEPISEDVVKTAVQAAKQEWAEVVERHQASQQTTAKAKKKPLSPKPAARGGGKGAGRSKGVKATLDNFDDFVAGR